LGDLRVFDRAGNVVPHTLRRPEALDTATPKSVDLPFFPLSHIASETDGDRTVRIVTNEKGAIIDVAGNGNSVDRTERISAYLVDASALETIPSGLALSWDGAEGKSFAVTVSLDASDDLSRWSSLVAEASLADLRFGDAKLAHSNIELPAIQAKYLRINWPPQLRDIRVTKVQAAFPRERRPPPRQWITLSEPSVTEDPEGLEFDSGGYWPADRIRLAFPTRNAVVKGALMSRPQANAKWRTHYRGLFYRLEQNGAKLLSERVNIVPTADPYWRFEPSAKADWPTGEAPSLELGWTPHELTFVAQGEPPYTLAYGSAVTGPSMQSVDALLRMIEKQQELDLIQPARVSQRVLLGGKARLTPPPPPLPWKQWILWAILILGVVFLAWMVRRLMKQLGDSGLQGD
jgi:hypothetical protein